MPDLMPINYSFVRPFRGRIKLNSIKRVLKYLTGNQPLLVRFLLAMAYLETSQWTKAAAAFRKLGIDPASGPARDALRGP